MRRHEATPDTVFRSVKRVFVVVCCCAVAACGSAETDLETAFCALLAADPSLVVEAADEPEVARESEHVLVRLEQTDSGYSGRVKFSPDESGSFAIGLGADVPFVVSDADGNQVQPQTRVDGAACADLAVRYTVPLDQQQYWIDLGPSDIPEIAIVAEESDDDL